MLLASNMIESQIFSDPIKSRVSWGLSVRVQDFGCWNISYQIGFFMLVGYYFPLDRLFFEDSIISLSDLPFGDSVKMLRRELSVQWIGKFPVYKKLLHISIFNWQLRDTCIVFNVFKKTIGLKKILKRLLSHVRVSTLCYKRTYQAKVCSIYEPPICFQLFPIQKPISFQIYPTN